MRTLAWKIPVVLAAMLAGILAADQAGWSGAALLLHLPSDGIGNFITDLLFTLTTAITIGALVLVRRIASRALWVMVPLLAYAALVDGVWNGVLSDFDYTRGEALRHHAANADAVEHMTTRGRFLSCQDSRITLTDDGKAACRAALTVKPGEIMPGSEHSCGWFGIFTCVNSAPEHPKRGSS